jgi:hypothetical protein
MEMEQTGCSKTLEFKLHTSGSNPEESMWHSERGDSFKSTKIKSFYELESGV